MDPALRLHPGQQELTPVQEAEAQRFAAERLAAQLATSAVDEPETEQLLRQAYAAVGLPPPETVLWLSGPLELLTVSAFPLPGETNRDTRDRASPRWNLLPSGVRATIGYRLGDPSGFLWGWLKVEDRIKASVETNLWDHLWASVGGSLSDLLWDHIVPSIQTGVNAWIEADIWARLPAHLWDSMRALLEGNSRARIINPFWDSSNESIMAYERAPRLACFRFLDVYLAPNDLHALAHFSERVSGYWLGSKGAVLVRRPRVLARDHGDRLHNATGKCVEYPDGWGFYAWHGVRVPEQVILAPETLTREDFLTESNIEVRRVIQERMGERFVTELGGVVIDSSPRGTLYEVGLGDDDPERVARYVQVRDASTARQYFLRVPPTVQTATEAVAWSFHLLVEEYHPAKET